METESEEQSSGFQPRDVLAIVQMQWRVVVACMVAGALLALLHGTLATRLYTAKAVVFLSPVAGQELKADQVVDNYERWNRQLFLQTQLEIIRSRSQILKVVERFQADGYDSLTTDNSGVMELRGMLKAIPRVGTELLDISVTSDNADEAAALALLVAEVYEAYSLEQRRNAARGAEEWLDEKTKEQNSRIDEISHDLVDFMRSPSQGLAGEDPLGLADVSEDAVKFNLADVNEEVTSASARMSSLNTALAETTTSRVLLETTVTAHKAALRRGQYESLAKDMNSTLVDSLTADYARAVTDHARVSARYGEKMPEYRQSQAQLDRFQEELKAEVERTLAAEEVQLRLLKDKEEQLQTAINTGKTAVLDSQWYVEEYAKKRMELERAREFYVRLNQRKDELELQSQTQLNNVQIIDPPLVPKRPVWPKVPLNVGLGLMGGLLLGLGLGLLREFVDDTISSPLEVQTFLRVPFLGLIPQIEDEVDETELALHTHRQPKSRVAEAMRAIRTVLELNSLGVAPKRLLVTSAVSSEGKTSTVVRLGVAFANLDKRVLIIDADLRRPRMHKIFLHEKIPGLSAVLGGVPLDEAVMSTGVANLDYLPSGRGGERPNELLASPKMLQLLDDLADVHGYDLVLIDSPPSVILSDARILSRYVEGVVMVVREHTTARGLIREAITGLEQVGANTLGVIVNAVDLSHRRTSYKYYYGYGYGYGYGHRYGSPYLDANESDDETEQPES